MDLTVGAVLAVVAGYFIGGLESAVVVARARGVDIRRAGSGNPGASNVFRVLGTKAGAIVFLFDVAKGLAATLIGSAAGGSAVGALAGFAAVVGHCYPVFFKFRGGKGGAAFGGMVLGLYPLVAVLFLVVFAVIVAATKIASLATIAATVVGLPAVWLAGARGWVFVWILAAGLLVLFRHRGNIARLVTGRERKVRD